MRNLKKKKKSARITYVLLSIYSYEKNCLELCEVFRKASFAQNATVQTWSLSSDVCASQSEGVTFLGSTHNTPVSHSDASQPALAQQRPVAGNHNSTVHGPVAISTGHVGASDGLAGSRAPSCLQRGQVRVATRLG
jgi:hypothetical protein